MARRKPIPNLVRIPGEGSCAVWSDGIGNGYEKVRDTYMAFLRLMFPAITTYEHELPPVQRHDHAVPLIPNIGQFYPCGCSPLYVQMTPEQQRAASELYVEIGRAIQGAYSEGVRNGSNLLLKLAKGETSLSDFDGGVAIVKPKDEDGHQNSER
jgi:hypothetical protein